MERIILDVDSAGDDILAILFALGCEGIHLEGVTAVTGAAGEREGVEHDIRHLLDTAGSPRD